MCPRYSFRWNIYYLSMLADAIAAAMLALEQLLAVYVAAWLPAANKQNEKRQKTKITKCRLITFICWSS